MVLMDFPVSCRAAGVVTCCSWSTEVVKRTKLCLNFSYKLSKLSKIEEGSPTAGQLRSRGAKADDNYDGALTWSKVLVRGFQHSCFTESTSRTSEEAETKVGSSHLSLMAPGPTTSLLGALDVGTY